LQELLAGNQRFVANQLTSIEHDLAIQKERTVEKQELHDVGPRRVGAPPAGSRNGKPTVSHAWGR